MCERVAFGRPRPAAPWQNATCHRPYGPYGFLVGRLHMAAAERAAQGRVNITWTPIDDDDVLVTATCEQCVLVRERSIKNEADAGGLALLVGAEALAQAGCPHVEAVTMTRKAPPASE